MKLQDLNGAYFQVTVEYGADLLSSELDSGFPTMKNFKDDVEREYALDPWNLTKFADLEDSVLKYISEPISGEWWRYSSLPVVLYLS